MELSQKSSLNRFSNQQLSLIFEDTWL